MGTGGPPRWLREVPFAHRGLHDAEVPENSLAAFAAARDAGYGVELDVHLTRDGVPVVLHDPSLARVAEVDRLVGLVRADELARMRLRGTDESIPTLAAALRLLVDTPTMIEVKALRVGAGPLSPAVAEVMAASPGPQVVAGFNPATLRWFRRHRPEVPRVLTSSRHRDLPLPGLIARRLARLRDLERVAPDAVAYGLPGLPTPVVTRWRDAGGIVLAWTVRTAEELTRAREVADNVIFEGVRPGPPSA